ncbi:MAG TPA: futalosine hydrolase [Chitinophagales bacterium]|nr:futalosine hydrolase [Chitinophagales bacterium]
MSLKTHKVTIVSASLMEIKPLFLQYQPIKSNFHGLWIASEQLHFLITGMGMLNTATHLAIYTQKYTRDFYINAGICGAFNKTLKIGDVLQISSETYGDFGVESDDQFQDFFKMGFIDRVEDAFQYGQCVPIPSAFHLPIHLPKAISVTVNKVHSNPKSIQQITEKYRADIENMEGLAFYYVLKQVNQPGIEIRSVSNYVEKRNNENWDIQKAVIQLNKAVQQLLS